MVQVLQKACRKATLSKVYISVPKTSSFEKDVDLGFPFLVHGYTLDLYIIDSITTSKCQ